MIEQWFSQNKDNLRPYEKNGERAKLIEDKVFFLPFFEKEPDWEKFHQYYFPDGREVFEINLENEEMIVRKEVLEKHDQNTFRDHVIQNIMFVENLEGIGYTPFIARYQSLSIRKIQILLT
ncbi:hypothetical protein [Pararhodonellum marinum]|uniref:hypothetical protein n=1 Tax=Pararhodonellum marinum TaxID=2755358 RepID=UPI00188E91A7|nr:hypothetical protein [Pararhodonellum marinum]